MPQTSNKFAKYVTLLHTIVRSRKLEILNTRHSSTQKPKQSCLFLEDGFKIHPYRAILEQKYKMGFGASVQIWMEVCVCFNGRA
ncbi:hypothetical protein NC653_001194 [Populus alba x Populus x berolinensis]|uniref:Uncharacterized protein n=1 Tax=Populus alba x Populus x berolinensis TaxID=444605 RepID=A0AAD6WF71_9ROSI|nr:hypothetical protein NC653_001194 [Populus alba x Populus x berolinensis]